MITIPQWYHKSAWDSLCESSAQSLGWSQRWESQAASYSEMKKILPSSAQAPALAGLN